MVRIVDYAIRENEHGEPFFTLIVQGGVELVTSKETGRKYITARKTSLPSTFDEETCKLMVGDTLPGTVKKVECAPYQYTIEKTGEVITLTHTYEYVVEEEAETVAAEMVHA